jgi:hypothetical protein
VVVAVNIVKVLFVVITVIPEALVAAVQIT